MFLLVINLILDAADVSVTLGCSLKEGLKIRKKGEFCPRRVKVLLYFSSTDVTVINNFFMEYCAVLNVKVRVYIHGLSTELTDNWFLMNAQ